MHNHQRTEELPTIAALRSPGAVPSFTTDRDFVRYAELLPISLPVESTT